MVLRENLTSGDLEHWDDHEIIHAQVGGGLPTTINSMTHEQHVSYHNVIHDLIGGLPEVTIGSGGHISHHEEIHSWYNFVISPPGGFPSGYEYPSVPASAVSVSTVSALRSAITNVVSGTTIVIEDGTYNMGSTTVNVAGSGSASNVTIMARNAPTITPITPPGGKTDTVYQISPKVIFINTPFNLGSSCIDAEGCTNIKFVGMQIQGARSSGAVNSGRGIKAGTTTRALWCKLYDHDNQGIGTGNSIIAEYCEFDRCGINSLHWGGTFASAAAIKTTGSLTAHHNYVHHCGYNGFWVDCNADGMKVEHNYFFQMGVRGVHYEITTGVLSEGEPVDYIRNNTASFVGYQPNGALHTSTGGAKPAGFAVVSSRHIIVEDNYAEECRRAGFIVWDDSDALNDGSNGSCRKNPGPGGGWEAFKVYLTNNTTGANNGSGPNAETSGAPGGGDYAIDVNNIGGVIQSGNT